MCYVCSSCETRPESTTSLGLGSYKGNRTGLFVWSSDMQCPQAVIDDGFQRHLEPLLRADVLISALVFLF